MQQRSWGSYLLLSLLVLGLSGCGSLFVKDNTERPARLANFKPQIKVKRLWTTNATRGSGKHFLRLQAAMKNGVIYTADTQGSVVATQAADGRRLWRSNIKAAVASGPAVGEDLVVVTTNKAKVIALDSKTGAVRWSVDASTESLASPTIAKGKVLIKSIDGNVYALSSRNGQKLWTYSHVAPNLILRASSAPQVAGNRAVMGFADGRLVALALNDGHVLWQQRIAQPQSGSAVDRMIDIDADPVIANGIVYVATYQGKLAALNLANGQILWRHPINSYTGLSVGSKGLDITDAKSHVWSFSRNNGSVMWQQKRLQARLITAPAIVNDAVVVGDSQGYLHWMSRRDGHFLARTKVSQSPILVAPAVQGQKLFVLSRNGSLSAYQVVS